MGGEEAARAAEPIRPQAPEASAPRDARGDEACAGKPLADATLVFGYAINYDVKHLTTAVLDESRSYESRELVSKMTGTDCRDFRVVVGGTTLAFMANGHVPGDGRYGPTMRKALDVLVEEFPEDGYIGKVDGGRMYGQGIITLTLAEACGIERDPERRRKMAEARHRRHAKMCGAGAKTDPQNGRLRNPAFSLHFGLFPKSVTKDPNVYFWVIEAMRPAPAHELTRKHGQQARGRAV